MGKINIKKKQKRIKTFKEQQKEIILNNPLKQVMWKLSLPAIIAMVLYGLNSFLDAVFVGQFLNENCLAGVAIAYPLTNITLGLGSLAGTGAAAILSIAIGANDKTTQQKILGNSTLLMLLSTILLTIPAYIFAEPLINSMGGRGEILQSGVEYFRVTLIGSIFWVYGLGLNMIIRGEGKMKEAAIMMTYGLVANVILNPIFILVFKMGVSGAAWATNVGMFIYCVVGYVYFRRGKASFDAKVNQISYDKDIFKSILIQGMPAFIMSVMYLVQAFVVFNALNNYGTEKDIAFFAAANRIMLFLFTPLYGLMRALQPVTGINYGAKNYDKVKQSFEMFTKTGFYFMLPFWLFMMFLPEQSLRMVLPDMTFTNLDILNYRAYMSILPFIPIVFMALSYFPAIKEGKKGSLIVIARQIVFYIPIMLLLPKFFGVKWVYWGSTIIDVTVVIWILYLVSKVFKKLAIQKKEI